MLVSGTPNAAVSLPFSLTGIPFPAVTFSIYDDAGFSGLLATNFFNPASGSASQSFNFSVPADGDYVLFVDQEVGTTTYTISTVVPEPGTAASRRAWPLRLWFAG
jgi:hypothetical protein